MRLHHHFLFIAEHDDDIDYDSRGSGRDAAGGDEYDDDAFQY